MKQNEPEAENTLFQLKDQAYQEILKEWEDMQNKFETADLKNYQNPFSGS